MYVIKDVIITPTSIAIMAVVDPNDLYAKIAMLVPAMTAQGINSELSCNVFLSISMLFTVTP